MAVAVKEEYQRALDEQQKEVRNLVVAGLEQINENYKGKKIYGIICLNSPTQQLIDKVHADKRIRLFEYQITYTEI